VRTEYPNLRIPSDKPRGFGAGTLILSLLVLLCFAVGGYCYFSPSLTERFPFACSLPAPPLATDKDVSPGEPIKDDPACAVSSAEVNCSQEIVDLSSPGDTLVSLLSSNLPDDSHVQEVAAKLSAQIRKNIGKRFSENTLLRSDRRYSITLDRDGKFLRATLEMDPANVFHAVLKNKIVQAWKEDVVLEYKVETISFPISGSLVESVLRAGEGRDFARELARVFIYDIDFQYEARKGDSCTVVFQRRYSDDRPAGYGDILYAVYDGVKAKKTAVLFNQKYYDADGVELKKSLLRSPLRALRVTSGYGWRFHPILHEVRHHSGVDYAAKQGTPAFAIARGVVTFAGWSGSGYGNYVCIKHPNGAESRYGHLSRIDAKMKKGARVEQGQRIGLVGKTGRATGPHLHFELLVAGKHIDPRNKIRIETPLRIAQPLRPRFKAVVQENESLLGKRRGLASAVSSSQDG
jgi:murein DD-endopeptidase MepM/ murein hydrolase activator NlpD